MDEWEAGRVIADRYRLRERIGSGGMGDVWRAEHLTLRSPVAIKVLRETIAKDKELSSRFLREAQAAAAIRSTNVVQVLDYGTEGDAAYIAMEFLDGESLRERLRAAGKLSAEETATILTQVGRAVSRAHKNGIVHRDLKPANIQLVDEEGIEVVKVLDFGIAKVLESFNMPTDSMATDESMSSTSTGALLGTPYYMSPEQLRGRSTIDKRTDVWAIAVIAYQCLLGRRPFKGETLGDLVMNVCAEDHPIPSDNGEVPAGFDTWFAKATSLEPDERFSSVTELIREMREVLLDESEPESRRVVESFETSSRSKRRASSEPPPSDPLGNTSMAQAQTLTSHPSQPPKSVADMAGGGRGLLGLGLVAAAGAAIFIAARMGAAPTPPPPATTQPASVAPAVSTPTAVVTASAAPTVEPAPSASASARPVATARPAAPPPVAPRTPSAKPKKKKKIEFGF